MIYKLCTLCIYIYIYVVYTVFIIYYIFYIYIYIYIHILYYIFFYYPPPCLQAHRACLRPLSNLQILQAFEEEGGRRSSSLGGSRSRPGITRDYPGLPGITRDYPGLLGSSRDYPEPLFSAFFPSLFSGPPFPSQREPKGFPNGIPKCLKV